MSNGSFKEEFVFNLVWNIFLVIFIGTMVVLGVTVAVAIWEDWHATEESIALWDTVAGVALLIFAATITVSFFVTRRTVRKNKKGELLFELRKRGIDPDGFKELWK